MSHKEQTQHALIPYGTYILVWLALLIFTGLTVTVAGLNLRSFGLVVALGIACFKSFLVVSYFMNIKFEASVFKIMVMVSIITLIIIIALTFLDAAFRG